MPAADAFLNDFETKLRRTAFAVRRTSAHCFCWFSQASSPQAS